MPHIPTDASGTGIMVLGGLVEVAFSIDAEGKALESVATPLTSTGESAATVSVPSPDISGGQLATT